MEQLVHFSNAPVPSVYSVSQGGRHRDDKPAGFWVSVESEAQGWRHWCESEDYRLGSLTCVHDVVLAPEARILRLTNADEIDDFTCGYGLGFDGWNGGAMAIDWKRLAQTHQGIVIAPYCWARRLDGGACWYYGWDCASGCIWDAAAIASITLRAPATLQAAE